MSARMESGDSVVDLSDGASGYEVSRERGKTVVKVLFDWKKDQQRPGLFDVLLARFYDDATFPVSVEDVKGEAKVTRVNHGANVSAGRFDGMAILSLTEKE